jgi:hypothetical protein
MDFRTASDFSKVSKALESLGNKRQVDERFWSPSVDQTGNGYAIVRFLPTPGIDGPDGSPIVKLFAYRFQGSSGRWYSENSPNTFGWNTPDPVSDMNRYFWDRGDEEGKAKVRKRKMDKKFITNVYVVEDPVTADAENNVYLYKFGVKLKDKIEEAGKPQSVHDVTINPFSLVEDGANFKISIITKKGADSDYRSFENSKFLAQKALSNSDEFMQGVWTKAYSLQELVSPDKFKSYAELESILREVEPEDYHQWKTNKSVHQVAKPEELDDEIPFDRITGEITSPAVVEKVSNEETADLDYFKKLINN